MKMKARLAKKNCIADAIQEFNQDKIGYVFFLVFVLLSALICVDNWIYFTQRANSDVAGEFLYMQKVYETGNPFTPAYANSSELFFSRPWLIFALFYTFGNNMIVSAKLTVLATWIVMVISAGYMFRMFGWRYQDIFAALTVTFGLMSLEVRYVLYMGFDAYSLFFAGIAVSLGMMAYAHRGGRIKIWHKIFYLAMAFYFGLCGIRMFIWLYCPVFLVDCLECIRDSINGTEKSKNGKFLKGGGNRKPSWSRYLSNRTDAVYAWI